LWEVRYEKPYVAVQCFEAGALDDDRETLINLTQSVQWKIDRSPEVRSTLLPFAEAAGIRITFTRLDVVDEWPAIRLMGAVAPEIRLGCVRDLAERLVADSSRVEHDLGASLADGVRAAWPNQELDAEAFVRAYDAAPPGVRSEEAELRVRGPLLPEPIEVQRAAISVAEKELAQALRARGVPPGRYEGQAATQLESEQVAPVLRSMLQNAMASFDRGAILRYALRQLERALCQKWSQARMRRQNERFPVLAYDPLELEVTEEQESSMLTRLVTVVAEESLLSGVTGSSGRLDA
jgi:hypothetical protein